jgi:hypothetical protein
MINIVEAVLEVLSYSPEILFRWNTKVNSGDIRNAVTVRV